MQTTTKAQQFKVKGNEAFQSKNYLEAIQFYSQAIAEDNTESVFFSNRSNCYYQLKRYQDACKDATEALELDEKNIKAHMIAGQSICMLAKERQESSKIDTGIQRILKARTLCAGQKKSEYEKEIDEKINKAKKLKWFIQQEEEKIKNQEIVQQLQDLVKNDVKLTQQEKQITLAQIDKYITNEKPKLEIPEYLQCHISKKLLIDPYTTEVGYSYEKALLFSKLHLNQDPYTNKPINPQIVYPNINLKQAASEFLAQNPWAYDFNPDQNYKDIEI
ncbi:unnamed protein product [Paramecium octaurelia]|uniref:RING-type E3 ubiquitin transferase n=1 Tax=Paramecium octaurelia TaxID=43137 RepID=A0A8S1V8B0_PAROT|nr:unnamed protein product [Paramecium octaurelia]